MTRVLMVMPFCRSASLMENAPAMGSCSRGRVTNVPRPWWRLMRPRASSSPRAWRRVDRETSKSRQSWRSGGSRSPSFHAPVAMNSSARLATSE